MRTLKANNIAYVQYIGITYPEYLLEQKPYNTATRELLMVPIYYGITIEEIKAELMESVETMHYRPTSYLTHKQIADAISEEMSEVGQEEIDRRTDEFFWDLQDPDNEIYLYVYLKWIVKK